MLAMGVIVVAIVLVVMPGLKSGGVGGVALLLRGGLVVVVRMIVGVLVFVQPGGMTIDALF